MWRAVSPNPSQMSAACPLGSCTSQTAGMMQAVQQAHDGWQHMPRWEWHDAKGGFAQGKQQSNTSSLYLRLQEHCALQALAVLLPAHCEPIMSHGHGADLEECSVCACEIEQGHISLTVTAMQA